MLEALGPYRIVRALGRGGMGRVLEAVGPDGRTVAIKTVALGDPGQRDAIRREIRALARLVHPGIVRIVGDGIDGGVPWYAMELIPGQTLRRYLELAAGSDTSRDTERLPAPSSGLEATERLTPPRVHRPDAVTGATGPVRSLRPGLVDGLAIVRRMCGALAFLHGEGLVHRDLKPDNVVLRPDGTPVLVDFGLAVTASGREALASADGPAGTVSYVAPEQAAGDLVDARADLYALGCILFEVVTGCVPYVGSDVSALLWQHRHAPVPRLSDLVPEAPEALGDLLERLLAKEPADRIGYAEDVDAALAALGVPAPPPAPSPRAYLYRPSLAGRKFHVATLADAIDALERRGEGVIMLLAGETGSGKTRLLLEAAGMAMRRGLAVLRGEASGAPLSALVGPLEQALDMRTGSADPVEEPLAAALVPYLPGRAGAAEAQELPPHDARRRLFAAVAAVLDGAADARPTVLLLDGLERADELTLGWLAHVVEGGPRERLVLVGAFDPERASRQLTALSGRAGLRVLQLEPLQAAEVAGLVASMLSCRDVPEGLPELLAERSAGNPFFVAEYLRLAVAEGLLRREAGAWVVAPSLNVRRSLRAYGALPVPGSLRDLALERVRALTPSAAETLGAIAILGPAARPGMLASLGREPPVVEAATHELLARDVVVAGEGGVLRPAQSALGEVARELLPAEVRRQVHLRAAEALEAPGDPGEMARAASHWEAVGDVTRARRFYRDAATREMARIAFAEAAELLQHFLRLSVGPSPEDVDASADLGRALRHCGRVADSAAPLIAARDIARRLGDPARESDVVRGLAHTRRQQGQVDEALALSREALVLARAVHAAREEAAALTTLGSVLSDLGQPGPARAAMEEALARSRSLSDVRGICNGLGTLGAIAFEEGRIDEADAHFSESLAVSKAHGNAWGGLHALANLAAMAATRGEDARARELSEEALPMARAIGDLNIEATLLLNIGVLDERRGAMDASKAHRRRALALFREIGDRRMAAVTLGGLAELVYLTGDVEKGLAMAEEALAMHRAVGNPRGEGMTLRLFAEIHRLEGRLPESRAAAEEALARASLVGDRRHEALSLATIAACVPDAGEAGRMLDRALDMLEAMGDEHALAGVLLDRAQAYRLAGELDRARALLERAAPLLERPEERAMALQATCERGLLAARSGEDPRPYLERAEVEAAAMGIRNLSLPGGRLTELRQAVALAEAGGLSGQGSPPMG